MKNKYIIATILAAIMVLSVVALVPSALANPKDADGNKIEGQLAYKINVIGVPENHDSYGAEKGSGRRIFIPLVTDKNGKNICDITGDIPDVPYEVDPVTIKGGVKILVTDGNFDVIDGSAMDGEAAFSMPANNYDVYIAAKGTPKKSDRNACLDLEAYVTDIRDTEGTNLYFIGSVDVDRSKGKPRYININKLFYVDGNPKAQSYLSSPFEDYFWQLYNDGLRNMEIRFYIAP